MQIKAPMKRKKEVVEKLEYLEPYCVDIFSVDLGIGAMFWCSRPLVVIWCGELLFELLEKHKDAKGNSAVFTAVSVVANPDFEKIKANDYKEYYFETFDKTLEFFFTILLALISPNSIVS